MTLAGAPFVRERLGRIHRVIHIGHRDLVACEAEIAEPVALLRIPSDIAEEALCDSPRCFPRRDSDVPA